MPIKITCSCGYAASVPDEMAGKTGRCPKCKSAIKIPAAAAAVATKPARPAASSPSPSKPTSALDGLLQEAGLTEKKGNLCPSCGSSVTAGSVICVKCGFHLTEGTKLEAHKVASTKGLGNKNLNEAAAMMEREAQTEKQINSAGSPWWMMLSVLVGISVLIGGLIIKQQAVTTEKKSTIEVFRRIQDADYLTVLAASFGLAMIMTSNFANLAILIIAFKESAKQGLLYFFVPFYALYYMFSRIKSKRLLSTVIILLVTGILGAIALAYSMPKI
jgi:hypothetical protein